MHSETYIKQSSCVSKLSTTFTYLFIKISKCFVGIPKIAVVPDWDGKGDEWKIELNINKKIHTDPKVYKDKEALAKMYEYYKYYYEKYRN